MKKNATILFLIFCSCFLQAQHTYHPFAASASTWNIDYRQGPNHFSYGTIIMPAGAGNDTMIGAQLYHKVTLLTVGYLGGLREDTSAQQVFYCPKDSLQEYLLYDFSVSVGDTVRNIIVIPVIGSGTNLYHAVVAAIDSVQLNNIYYYQYSLNPYYHNDPMMNAFVSVTWFERFGGKHGLLATLPFSSMGIDDYLQCMSVNDSSYMQNSLPLFSPISCSIILDVPVAEITELSVFPTLIEDHVDLKRFPISSHAYTAELFNSLGECIVRKNIFNRLDGLEDLSAGIYFLCITGNGVSYTQKLMKN